MRNWANYLLFALFVVGILAPRTSSQNLNLPNPAVTPLADIQDKCGYDERLAAETLLLFGDHWGYGYNDLLADLEGWAQSPYVTVDSLGASVQNRGLWQLTITSDQPPIQPRRTVFMHVRTHPGEVQAWWVTDEVIDFLTSEDDFARFIRDNCTFYIIPMYNPDGVELEYPRQNANRIDIESNWDKNPVEPEVAVLRNRFTELMNSDAPVECALNMHSAFACKRYFVYHAAAGTSVEYTQFEQTFIGEVRTYFEEGIEPWHYFVSWTNGTPPFYPESWFWLNFREAVMALTYEDMNCEAAGEYEKTAYALVHGVADYLGLVITAVLDGREAIPADFTLHQNFPNPIRMDQSSPLSTIIQYDLQKAGSIRLAVYDILGRRVKILDEGFRTANVHRVYFDASALPSGAYFYKLETSAGIRVRRLDIVK